MYACLPAPLAISLAASCTTPHSTTLMRSHLDHLASCPTHLLTLPAPTTSHDPKHGQNTPIRSLETCPMQAKPRSPCTLYPCPPLPIYTLLIALEFAMYAGILSKAPRKPIHSCILRCSNCLNTENLCGSTKALLQRLRISQILLCEC